MILSTSMESADTFDPTRYNIQWTSTFWATGLALVLYGIYINLFVLAIYTLSRRETAGKKVLLVACCTMFILGTAEIIVLVTWVATNIPILQELVDASNFGPTPVTPKSWKHHWYWLSLAELILIFNNLVTDLLFLYRCYKIWGSRKKVIILPAILVLSTAVVASVVISPLQETLDFDVRIPFALVVVTNLVLVGLTAGRIWWLHRREAFHIDVDDTFRNRYKMPIVLILESGALYCVCIVFSAIYSGARQPLLPYELVLGASSQIVNIAPTLIVVRVGLGHNIQDTITSQHPLQCKNVRSRQVEVEPSNSSWRVINIGPVEG